MAHVLVVDDNESVRETLQDQLSVFEVTSDAAGSALEAMARLKEREYDLIISDLKMPGMTGIEFLREVQKDIHRRTPCMIVTAWADLQYAVEAMQAGACNFLVKPWEIADLRSAVFRALEIREDYRLRLNYEKDLERRLAEARDEVRHTYEGTVSGIASMLEGKDTSTSDHCQRVAEYCSLLAREVGVPDDRIADVRLGALLHDIGKYKVPDRILLKPGKLTPEEWVEMRKHPSYGAEFVSKIAFLRGAREIIENHHERWDGGGYPRGLREDQIPIAARVFSVCDTYDAITQERCYKAAQPHEYAIEEIRRGAGTQFDPGVVAAFERIVAVFPAAGENVTREPVDVGAFVNERTPMPDRPGGADREPSAAASLGGAARNGAHGVNGALPGTGTPSGNGIVGRGVPTNGH